MFRKYGSRSCGLPRLYGLPSVSRPTPVPVVLFFYEQLADVHMDLEHNITDFLVTKSPIPYLQGFSNVSGSLLVPIDMSLVCHLAVGVSQNLSTQCT